jgi:hypothetical protein
MLFTRVCSLPYPLVEHPSRAPDKHKNMPQMPVKDKHSSLFQTFFNHDSKKL